MKKRVAHYCYVNLWLAVIWVLLLTYDGTLSPVKGTLLTYAGFVGLIHLRSLLRSLLGDGDARESADG